jgi:hypothetical protein
MQECQVRASRNARLHQQHDDDDDDDQQEKEDEEEEGEEGGRRKENLEKEERVSIQGRGFRERAALLAHILVVCAEFLEAPHVLEQRRDELGSEDQRLGAALNLQRQASLHGLSARNCPKPERVEKVGARPRQDLTAQSAAQPLVCLGSREADLEGAAKGVSRSTLAGTRGFTCQACRGSNSESFWGRTFSHSSVALSRSRLSSVLPNMSLLTAERAATTALHRPSFRASTSPSVRTSTRQTCLSSRSTSAASQAFQPGLAAASRLPRIRIAASTSGLILPIFEGCIDFRSFSRRAPQPNDFCRPSLAPHSPPLCNLLSQFAGPCRTGLFTRDGEPQLCCPLPQRPQRQRDLMVSCYRVYANTRNCCFGTVGVQFLISGGAGCWRRVCSFFVIAQFVNLH